MLGIDALVAWIEREQRHLLLGVGGANPDAPTLSSTAMVEICALASGAGARETAIASHRTRR